MKKSLLIFIATAIINGLNAQGNSVAVANPNVEGLYATPTICAKILQLELSKLNQYSVFDAFDMEEVYQRDSSYRNNCLSKSCLVAFGKELDADYMLTGSYDLLANKIVITLKMIDVKNNSMYKSGLREFTNQEKELQRMTEIVLKEMLGIPVNSELVDQLKFDNDIITKSNVGKVSNSGPRVGVGFMTGDFYEFATRSKAQGGMDIVPAISMIGYQLEAQYVGTDNFSALAEFILNVNGLEQGKFLPTLSILNGFRFGKVGWEFAFGPGFTLTRTSNGFFDTQGAYGAKDQYYSVSGWDSDWNNYISSNNLASDDYMNLGYTVEETLDERADVKGAFMFVMAFGRTFKAGALNIPVNIFYSSRGKGGIAGVNVGFNVTKSKSTVGTGI
ncbi:MAG: hypothetical protein VX280_00790 [Bacteroidota bacterium]|nr:hypothetical protein [Bacteroidota bacterium]